MDLKKLAAWLMLALVSVLTGVAIVVFYWLEQTPKPLEAIYPIDVVTQHYGKPSIIAIPQLSMIEAAPIAVSTSTIDLKGNDVFITPRVYLNQTTDDYSVLTYRNLPQGNYNVVVNVAYLLNPIKAVKQKFTLATLSVIGDDDDSNNSTAKNVCTINTK